jgi:hypothetical protein
MEEGDMKPRAGTFRTTAYLLFVLLISAALAACGSGGGGGTSPGVSGPATVNVSIASAPGFPAGATSSTSSPAPAAPPADSPTFEHLDVTVTKLALLPSSGEEGKTVTDPIDPPVQIDLLNFSGDNGATLLNQFSAVPAGEYSKIRVYYDTVIGRSGNDNTLFHPTANSHFDVHFMGGNLVIPVASDPVGGIEFFSVLINVVDGLKHHEAGQSGNVLLRPQVFATVVEAPKFIVTGVADQVNHADGTFNVITAGNDDISAEYGPDTSWFYEDGRFVGPFGISGADALRDTALVGVIGTFESGVLVAERVNITFPDSREGTADNVWIPPDNTAFIVRSLADNVTVFPQPDRAGAYYDNLVSPHNPLADTDLENDLQVKVRGYFDLDGDLEAYWISIGP